MSTSNASNTKRTRKVHQHQVAIQAPAHPEAIVDVDHDGYDEVGLAEDLYVDPMDENMDQRVHLAQERLSRLRKEAEEIEREKQQLEDLRRKQQSFMQGRTEMLDRLSRAVALLDRETQDSRRKVEQMLVMRDAFADHLEAVNSLTPEDWSRQDLQIELGRALGVIEDAKLEYDRSMSRLQAFTHVAMPTVNPSAAAAAQAPAAPNPLEISKETFRRWAFAGLAFTAPLLAVGLLATLMLLIFR